MSRTLLVRHSLRHEAGDYGHSFTYDERGYFNELLYCWARYDHDTKTCDPHLEVTIRGYEIYDQFMADFARLKEYIPYLIVLNNCQVVNDNGEIYNEDENYEKWLKKEMVIETAVAVIPTNLHIMVLEGE